VPKEIRKLLKKEVVIIPDFYGAAIFPSGTPPDKVIHSLETIIRELKLKEEERKK
jgi:hypothetical protein